VSCFTDPNALSAPDARALADRLLAHPLVGRSQLIGTFEGSRGFGVACTVDGRARALAEHPVLAPLLPCFDARPDALLPREGLLRPRPRAPNAFYWNVLVVDDGQEIGRHTDGTLGAALGALGTTPAVVSVVYLRVPDRRAGGDLVLFDDDGEVARVSPQVGMSVHFAGRLAHAIERLEGADGPRVSAVCEQYVLDDALLARLPALTVQSRASDPIFSRPSSRGRGFEALLRRASPNDGPGSVDDRQRPPRS